MTKRESLTLFTLRQLNKMNFREQLLNSPKPRHQFHDKESLAWLELNRPNCLPTTYKLRGLFIDTVEKERPWEKCMGDWFTNKLIRDGIHGFRHVCRVAIHSISLALQSRSDVSEGEIGALIYSALLHDCRRKNDNADQRHGIRASQWLRRNYNLIPQHLKSFNETILFPVEIHNDNYNKIIDKKKYRKFKFFVDVLKTADALDRYRFPREDWWIDEKFLVHMPSNEDMAFAYDLALESEREFITIKNNTISVEQSWGKNKLAD